MMRPSKIIRLEPIPHQRVLAWDLGGELLISSFPCRSTEQELRTVSGCVGRVESDYWEAGFRQAHRITMEACFDLKYVYQVQDVAFFTDKGVALGIALSYIGDIPVWADTLKS
ncbi:hypothetical protein HZ326_15608 [Fusarium oxysporum f. sp. albedinis]|nr:hypothetical protein HZ326_15608 [Fusarium oxysporum f. sp. albedinis]